MFILGIYGKRLIPGDRREAGGEKETRRGKIIVGQDWMMITIGLIKMALDEIQSLYLEIQRLEHGDGLIDGEREPSKAEIELMAAIAKVEGRE